jgi:flavorubredoxin
VVGSEKTVIVDTGHFAHWYAVEPQLEQSLAGRTLDYILPSHQEIPHSGNLGRLMAKYPDSLAIGDVRDYHLFFPEIEQERLVMMSDGDSVPLGDGERFVILDAIWKDLTGTSWGYDTRLRALFPSDGLGYIHDHEPEVCGLTVAQLPADYVPFERWRFALPFIGMKFQSTLPGIERFRRMMAEYPTEIYCSAHGAPMIEGVAEFTETMLGVIAENKSSMSPS